MNLLGKVVGFVTKLKVVWKAWDVRSFIVASFTFQLFLILTAPFRKRSSSHVIRISTWLSYLLADWVAAQAVGLIAKATQNSDTTESDLFGLWAQFLLLHLGGPDTITALALEDNELWLRTTLHLGTQAYATLGILVRSVRQSTLWVATVLMFFAGVIKYLERVTSLHHGRLMDIDEDPYLEYMLKLLRDKRDENNRLSNVIMVRGSYWLFHAYKSLYADLQLNPDVRKAARKYFMKRTPQEAYIMVEMQLNFMYEAMYTKMMIIHNRTWKILRHIVLSLQVACLVIWCFWDKRGFHAFDIRVTYVLLIGAIVVDLLAFLRVQLSDWTIALLDRFSEKRSGLYNKLLSARSSLTWGAQTTSGMWSWFRRMFLMRWSVSIYYYYGYSVSAEDPEFSIDKVTGCLNPDSLHRRSHIIKRPLSSEMWDYIFEVLTKPCEQSYELPVSGMVDMDTLLERALPIHILDYLTVFLSWSTEVDHYASEYNSNMSAALLNYLVYLFAFQPNMMYGAAGKRRVVSLQKQERIMDRRCRPYQEEEREDFEDEDIDGKIGGEIEDEEAGDNGRKKGSFGLLALKSNRRKDRIREANEQMEEVIKYVISESKWDVLARIWAEFLFHAAITCKPSVHAANLKEGGEFLTFIWLLMVHLGIEVKTFA